MHKDYLITSFHNLGQLAIFFGCLGLLWLLFRTVFLAVERDKFADFGSYLTIVFIMISWIGACFCP